jgi:hypothetical protein
MIRSAAFAAIIAAAAVLPPAACQGPTEPEVLACPLESPPIVSSTAQESMLKTGPLACSAGLGARLGST